MIETSQLRKEIDGKINVCMKYYQNQYECFSDWQRDELKALSKWFNKMHQRTVDQVIQNTQTCHAHLGRPDYAYPSGLSPDIKIYGLDVGAKQRVHGAFVKDQFYLIWLDREHRLLGKN